MHCPGRRAGHSESQQSPPSRPAMQWPIRVIQPHTVGKTYPPVQSVASRLVVEYAPNALQQNKRAVTAQCLHWAFAAYDMPCSDVLYAPICCIANASSPLSNQGFCRAQITHSANVLNLHSLIVSSHICTIIHLNAQRSHAIATS